MSCAAISCRTARRAIHGDLRSADLQAPAASVKTEVPEPIRTGAERTRDTTRDHDSVARSNVAMHTIETDRARPLDYDDDDIEFVIDVLGRPFARRPNENREIEILRRIAPDRAATIACVEIDNAHLARAPPDPWSWEEGSPSFCFSHSRSRFLRAAR